MPEPTSTTSPNTAASVERPLNLFETPSASPSASVPTRKRGRPRKITESKPRAVLNFSDLFTDEDLESLLDSPDIATMRERLRGSISDRATQAGLEQLRTIESALRSRRVADHQPRTEEEVAFLDWIAERWRTLTKRGPEASMTPKRAGCVLARFREGRTQEEFDGILRWCAGNDWMSGRDPKTNGRSYDDLPTLFGSVERFEKYLDLSKRRGGVMKSPSLRAGAPPRQARIL